MAASRGIRTAIAGMRSLAPGIMNMVSDGLQVLVNVWIEMLPRLPLIPRPLNDVIQVRNDTRLDTTLAAFVKVDTPGIACPPREQFELAFAGMKPPDAR